MLGSRQKIFSVDCSVLYGMRIIGSEARLGMHNTRLGETHGRGPLDCTEWVRLMGEACMVMIVWVRPGGIGWSVVLDYV